MKFYGNGVVWNTDTDSALCKFIDGEFETNDEYVIDRLKTKGYGRVAEVDEVPIPMEVTDEPTDEVDAEVVEPTNKESLTVEVPEAPIEVPIEAPIAKTVPTSAKTAQVKKAVKK